MVKAKKVIFHFHGSEARNPNMINKLAYTLAHKLPKIELLVSTPGLLYYSIPGVNWLPNPVDPLVLNYELKSKTSNNDEEKITMFIPTRLDETKMFITS